MHIWPYISQVAVPFLVLFSPSWVQLCKLRCELLLKLFKLEAQLLLGAQLIGKKTCLLVEQEDMSSCRTRRHVFTLQREDKSSCQESTSSLHFHELPLIRR